MNCSILAYEGAVTMKRSRRNHSPAFKAKIALQAIRGDKTLSGSCGPTFYFRFLVHLVSHVETSTPIG